MFRKILHPTDFSEPSHKAFKVLKEMVKNGVEEVYILNVVDVREIATIANMEGFSSLRYDELEAEIERKMKEKAKARVIEMANEIESGSSLVKAVGLVKIGIPFEEINRFVKEEGIELVILGSHGKSWVAGMLLGSTSEKVIRKVSCPVLVVK